MTKNDGGNVFPIWTPDMPVEGCSGMTLRQWYAGRIAAADMNNTFIGSWATDVPDELLRKRCRLYWRIADALLATEEEE